MLYQQISQFQTNLGNRDNLGVGGKKLGERRLHQLPEGVFSVLEEARYCVWCSDGPVSKKGVQGRQRLYGLDMELPCGAFGRMSRVSGGAEVVYLSTYRSSASRFLVSDFQFILCSAASSQSYKSDVNTGLKSKEVMSEVVSVTLKLMFPTCAMLSKIYPTYHLFLIW